MAVACESCGQPVHETAVDCPHCGELTGVPVDPIAETEIELLPELGDKPKENPIPLLDRRHAVIDPIGRAVATGVARLAEAVAPADDDERLPRAIARKRPKK